MIWVLTAGFGDGHNSAAAHVAAALRARLPAEPVQVMDLMAMTTPRLAALCQAGYRHLIVHQPWLWKALFDAFASPSLQSSTGLIRPLMDRLSLEIGQQQPRLIISTYPAYATLLSLVRVHGRSVPPLVTVITDAIAVHPTWTTHPSDALCVIDDATAAVTRSLAGPTAAIHVTGFPIDSRWHHAEPPSRVLRAGILYLPSTPSGAVSATLAALRPLLTRGIPLTIAPGRHASRYYHVLRAFQDQCTGLPLRVLAWTDQMPELLRQHSVVITKAGGAITNEALAARTPVIIDYVVPGQEEGNAQRLVEAQWARRSHSPSQTYELANALLGSEGDAVSQRMAGFDGALAADRVVDVALSLIK